MRRTNHWPTIAMLTTDSALCPSARVKVMATANCANEWTQLIKHTTVPSATAITASTTRLPARSMKRPMPKAPSEPINVAQRFSCA
jgi:hypothetical protein